MHHIEQVQNNANLSIINDLAVNNQQNLISLNYPLMGYNCHPNTVKPSISQPLSVGDVRRRSTAVNSNMDHASVANAQMLNLVNLQGRNMNSIISNQINHLSNRLQAPSCHPGIHTGNPVTTRTDVNVLNAAVAARAVGAPLCLNSIFYPPYQNLKDPMKHVMPVPVVAQAQPVQLAPSLFTQVPSQPYVPVSVPDQSVRSGYTTVQPNGPTNKRTYMCTENNCCSQHFTDLSSPISCPTSGLLDCSLPSGSNNKRMRVYQDPHNSEVSSSSDPLALVLQNSYLIKF